MRARNLFVTLLLTIGAITAQAAVPGSKSNVAVTGESPAIAGNHRAEEHVVKRFAGNGDQRTYGFSVDDSWELRWRVEPMTQFENLGGFRADVYDAMTNRFLGSLGENIRDGNGEIRMDIDCRF